MNLSPWSTVSTAEASDRVTVIQHLVRAHGHAVAVDGTFGPATLTAVQAFQRRPA